MQRDFSFLRPLRPTVIFATYWRFAAERQRIFLRRVNGGPAPWTSDPILSQYKFTNAYRASDRTSQYLIRQVIYNGDQKPEEIFFRTLLFKFFNKIETWETLKAAFGQIRCDDFSVSDYNEVLCRALLDGQRVYSGAYIMPSGGRDYPFPRKHQMHLALLSKMISQSLPERLAEASTMADAFVLLRAYPTIGDFLAYQYVTDLNYSTMTRFDEMEFVIPGPGARDGIRKCFSDLGGFTESQVIKIIAERQEECFSAVDLEFPTLWGRSLQLIDCQNLFCELDKYARVAFPDAIGRSGRTRIKQRFRPLPKIPMPWYPPKWGLNSTIEAELHSQRNGESQIRSRQADSF